MKKLLSILLAFVMLLSIVLALPVPASAESLYIRKIVSVVYDDSGSMTGDKWAYANYAMQAFCGMLNSEDQLFVTYMSHSQQQVNYEPEKIDLSSGGIQASVNSIRNHTSSGSTPYKAVEKAFEKLKTVNDPNPNTQYWLVVITDGDFDEIYSAGNSEKKKFLNDKFETYTETVMPNGTKPQVTFLGIGNVASPDQDTNQGIYTYSASSSKAIIGAMSEMADRISGRTRLQSNAVKKIDDNTIRVSSAIPLLNIAVFAQGSQAKITGAAADEGEKIPISREASLRYSNYSDLVGGAFLLGDSTTIIGAGSYDITFDRSVDLEDVVVLFEPALEMRMTLTLNGQTITDYRDLDDTMVGDKVSVSCKIYEMGTNNEIDPALMPTGTTFEIVISEDGKVVKQHSGKDMQLSDFVLRDVETEIRGAVTIEGFNPIDFAVEFTPTKYVPRVTYTVSADFVSDVKSVRYDEISTNEDLAICFTVYADGVAMTDVDAVKALNPVINVSPQGNDGTITYSNDGKIIFTPSAASKNATSSGSFDVDVTCTLGNGSSAKETYKVILTTYTISAGFVGNVKSVKFDDISTNKDLAICFTVYADGVAMTDVDAVKALNPVINVSPQGNEGAITYSSDGKIIFTPNKASEDTGNAGSFSVSVTCQIDSGATATETYAVVLATYQVVPVNTNQTIKKTQLHDNAVSVSFYVTKDGVKLDKLSVEKHISVLLPEEYAALKANVVIAPDGTITITPYSEEQRVLNFGNWWLNWAYYWGLANDDIAVTLNHSYGTGTAVIDVVGEDFDYMLFAVWTPFLIELIVTVLFLTWLYLVVTKPRFLASAVLYVGTITYDSENQTHILRSFTAVRLSKFNRIRKGNGRLKFKKKADVVNAGGIKIRADHGGKVICEMPFPWYKDRIIPHNTLLRLSTPVEVADYLRANKRLEINEFSVTNTVNGENERVLMASNPRTARCIVVPATNGMGKVDLGNGDFRRVIKSGRIFIYMNI